MEALNETLLPLGSRARPGPIVFQEERNEQEFVFFVQTEGSK